MEVSVETKSSLERRLTITVPENEIDEQCRTKMSELAKQVRLKGFRPGKVPKNILQQKFGKSVRAEVIGEAIQNSLQEALKKNELKPAGMPQIEDVQDEKGKPLQYVAMVEIYPEINLADLSEVEIEKKVVNVSDQDIQKTLENMAANMGTWEEVDREAQSGDKLSMDLERTWVEDLEEDDPQSYNDIDLLLDDEKSLPSLVKALIGKKAGFEDELEIAYPKEWQDEKLKGKKAKFKVRVHKVLDNKPLTLEELAEKFELEKDDQQGLKDKIKERLEKEAKKALQEELKEQVLEVLLEKNPIEKPKALLKQEKESLEREIENKRKQMAATEELSEEEMNEIAEKRVVLGLLVNEIIHKHDIKVNNQKVREFIGEQAASFPDPKQFISYYYTNKELLQGVERIVLLEQAVDKLLDSMKVVEKQVNFEEAMNPSEENDKS